MLVGLDSWFAELPVSLTSALIGINEWALGSAAIFGKHRYCGAKHRSNGRHHLSHRLEILFAPQPDFVQEFGPL